MTHLQDGLVQWALAAGLSIIAALCFFAVSIAPLPLAAAAGFVGSMTLLVCVFYFLIGCVSLFLAGRAIWSQDNE